MRFDAVRLRGTGTRGAVHKRTLEAVSSSRRSFKAGEVLCNHHWGADQLESAPREAINCSNCARREAEIAEARRKPGSRGTDRPFMEATIDELEKLMKQHRTEAAVLGRLREELTFRTKPRAKQLRREVEGLIQGLIPVEKGIRAAQPEDQLGLLDS